MSAVAPASAAGSCRIPAGIAGAGVPGMRERLLDAATHYRCRSLPVQGRAAYSPGHDRSRAEPGQGRASPAPTTATINSIRSARCWRLVRTPRLHRRRRARRGQRNPSPGEVGCCHGTAAPSRSTPKAVQKRWLPKLVENALDRPAAAIRAASGGLLMLAVPTGRGQRLPHARLTSAACSNCPAPDSRSVANSRADDRDLHRSLFRSDLTIL